MAEGLRVRRARNEDISAIAPLIRMPAAEMYDGLAGSEENALRLIAGDLKSGGRYVTWVAELDGRPVGAMVAYPYRDDSEHMRRHMRLLIRHSLPWRWPRIVLRYWRGQRRAPDHPGDWLYVDALATHPGHRRRGVALAMLEHAEHVAVGAGRSAVALDVSEANEPALALYDRAGFRVVRTAEVPGLPYRAVTLGKDL